MLNAIVLAAVLATSTGGESEINNVSEFLVAYDTGTPVARKAYELSVSSTEQGLLFANSYLVAHHESSMYCQPAKLTLTSAQMIDMLREEVKADHKLADVPVAFAILQVLVTTFPCPQ
jgi:hypothetical protein